MAGGSETAIVNLRDFEALAKSKMDPVDFDYFASGAEDEITLERNVDAWRHIILWPRFLVDVSQLALETRCLGLDIAAPLMVPPMAMQKLAHPVGEVGRGCGLIGNDQARDHMRGSARAKVVPDVCVPGSWSRVARCWHWGVINIEDRAISEQLIRRAEASGVKAIVITVDSPMLGRRERDLRNKFTPQSRGVEIVNWTSGNSSNAGQSPAPTVQSRIGSRDMGMTWAEGVAWARSVTKLPVILKGIVHPKDAELAVRHGCAAVWVSNHGGRQLDGGPATAQALPLVAQAVCGRVPILVDGGVSRGADVLKALAMGASIVCVGRPLLWALAADGERGAHRALDMVQDELRTAMALSGVPSVRKVPRSLVQTPTVAPPFPRL